MNESFEKLNNLFDTESGITENLKEVKNELQTINQKKNEIKEIVQKNEVGFSIEDQGFLIEATKKLMESTDNVMQKLEQDIKIGSSPRMYEVFSFLANSKVNQLRELRELYKMILEMSIFNEEDSNKSKNENDVSMTATDLLKVIKEAQKSSSLNAIEATFKVVENEEEQKEKKNNDVFKNNFKPKKKRKIEDDE